MRPDRAAPSPSATTAGTAAEGNDPRITGALQKEQNGADIPGKGAFRTNLNLGVAATLNAGVSGGVALYDDTRFAGALQAALNGSNIPDKAKFRQALGLGGAEQLGVGTAAGTVAAGDDPRFSAIAANAITNYGAKGDGATECYAALLDRKRCRPR